jgi:hypothetical protein
LLAHPNNAFKRECPGKSSGSREDGKGMRMEKAYEEYFESLAEGEVALSFAEFVEAIS